MPTILKSSVLGIGFAIEVFPAGLEVDGWFDTAIAELKDFIQTGKSSPTRPIFVKTRPYQVLTDQ